MSTYDTMISPMCGSTGNRIVPKSSRRRRTRTFPPIAITITKRKTSGNTPARIPAASSFLFPYTTSNDVSASMAASVGLYLLHPIFEYSPSPPLSPPLSPTFGSPPTTTMTARHKALLSFCRRILHATRLSPQVVLLALKYVERLVSRTNQGIGIGNQPPLSSASFRRFPSAQPRGLKLSPRNLLIVAMMLANKFHDDRRFANAAWAAIGGIDLQQLNAAERECLAALGYQLVVPPDEFSEWTTTVWTIVETVRTALAAQQKEPTIPPAAAPAATVTPVLVNCSGGENVDSPATLSQGRAWRMRSLFAMERNRSNPY